MIFLENNPVLIIFRKTWNHLWKPGRLQNLSIFDSFRDKKYISSSRVALPKNEIEWKLH
jgi:hypothetical protein